MARSASWSCPSSVDWAFTLTDWHTGIANSHFQGLRNRYFVGYEYIVSYELFVFGFWRTLLKVTSTAL